MKKVFKKLTKKTILVILAIIVIASWPALSKVEGMDENEAKSLFFENWRIL